MNSSSKRESNPHPRATANPLSIMLFGWTHNIFKKGYKKDLELEDMYDPLEEHQSDLLGNKLEKMWNKEVIQARDRDKEPSLLKVILKCFGPKALLLGIILGGVETIFRISQPIFLGGLIRYFSEGSVFRETAFIYAACIIVCSTVNVVVKQAYMLAMFHIGMKMRVGICSLLYRKTLRLSMRSLGETTIGQATNLLSNDVSRFDSCLIFTVYVWIGPIHAAIMTYLMWREIRIAALAGVATILLIIPVQVLLGKLIATLRMRTAKRTDVRIRFMNEIIVGIQVIKMYAWEKPFAYLVALTRRHEINAIQSTLFTRGLLLATDTFATRIAIFVSIITYYFLRNDITAEKVFVVTAYFNIMKMVMTDFFPRAIQVLAESSVSVKRVQKFLLYDEISNINLHSTTNEKKPTILKEDEKEKKYVLDLNTSLNIRNGLNDGCDIFNKGSLMINNITAKWTEDLNDNTLTDLSLDVKPRSLVAIVGPIGSGKTSLLLTILKELPLTNGSIFMGGTLSYSSQESWLFTGSVRQNILFGQHMNKKRYRKVIKVCALERDFQLMPHSDRTIVGERGITLSGGQRARINLARAIYKEADIYLLDDPLSAVDTHVGRHLFEDCICDFLKDKTRILVTHQLQYLQSADCVAVLKKGTIIATDSFSKLQASGLDFIGQLGLDTEIEHKETEDNNVHDNELTHSVKNMKRQDSETSQISSSGSEPKQASEIRSKGQVKSNVYSSYLTAGGNWFFITLVFGTSILAQLAVRGGDYWMAYWTNVEEQRLKTILLNNSEIVNSSAPLTLNYTTSTSEFWGWMPSTETSIYTYVGFMVSVIILTVSSTLLFFKMSTNASVNLHNAMFDSITRATMKFFNVYPSGQILNRFSKDMGSVDESLPPTMIDCIQRGLTVLGVVIVVAVVNTWLLIPSVLMFVVFYFLRKYYLSTSRSLKRLEGITRSPVFSHLSASLQGLTTIRAFGAQTMLEKEFDTHQDSHSSVWYLFISIGRAFGLWIDAVCLIYIALVTLSFLIIGGTQYGGDVGLAITQAIGLTGMLQWGIRQSAELENQMTSVERILEYTKVEKEPPLESTTEKKPPKNWPSKGEIVFDGVFMSYSKDEPSILNNISLNIKSSEKVGIVGRTGAGKTSLISVLFRLVDLTEGSIYIDTIDINQLGLHDIRKSISIIPQEPALFSGPLRENLDPFNQYSDAELWSALSEVELKQTVQDLPAGLSHRVSEGGSNFSVGQRQLLCLARAIIRKNKILVLDEATANVDLQTDELIQTTIRHKFASCTVLTIAHRLQTVMDNDRIIVMDAGSVVEFDHPYLLLKNKNGYFYNMVQQTGHVMAEIVLKLAKESYEKNLARKE